MENLSKKLTADYYRSVLQNIDLSNTLFCSAGKEPWFIINDLGVGEKVRRVTAVSISHSSHAGVDLVETSISC